MPQASEANVPPPYAAEAAEGRNGSLNVFLFAAGSRGPATGHRGTAVPVSRHRSLTERCSGLAPLAAELRLVRLHKGVLPCFIRTNSKSMTHGSCSS